MFSDQVDQAGWTKLDRFTKPMSVPAAGLAMGARSDLQHDNFGQYRDIVLVYTKAGAKLAAHT